MNSPSLSVGCWLNCISFYRYIYICCCCNSFWFSFFVIFSTNLSFQHRIRWSHTIDFHLKRIISMTKLETFNNGPAPLTAACLRAVVTHRDHTVLWTRLVRPHSKHLGLHYFVVGLQRCIKVKNNKTFCSLTCLSLRSRIHVNLNHLCWSYEAVWL